MLTPQQVRFFEIFGFLKLEGLFRDDIDEITSAYEEVWKNDLPRLDQRVPLHDEQPRTIMMRFTDQHPVLAKLPEDPRVTGAVSSLLGDSWEFAQSDASLFDCETHWHADFYGAELGVHHVKLSFYLDRLRADSGAPRFIPGSNDYESGFARALRKTFWEPAKVTSILGVDPRDVPSTALESDPGDVVVWDFRTIHASYRGGMRRRLLSLNFRETARAAE